MNHKKLPLYLTEEDYVEVLENTNCFHHKVGFMLAWESGMRISEVMSLQPKDVDVERNMIRINDGKGGKDRIVPLPFNWREKHFDFLPMPCSNRAMQKAFENASIKSELMEKRPGIHFHSLRHGFATYCYSKGMSIERIQLLLGHSDIQTTMIYIKVFPKPALDEHMKKVVG